MNNDEDFQAAVFEIYIFDGFIRLDNIPLFKVGEKVVFLANDVNSMQIISKERLQKKVNDLKEAIKRKKSSFNESSEINDMMKEETELKNLYDSIIGTSEVYKVYHHTVPVIPLNVAKYFLSSDVLDVKMPVVLKICDGTLTMYYGIEEFKNSVNRR